MHTPSGPRSRLGRSLSPPYTSPHTQVRAAYLRPGVPNGPPADTAPAVEVAPMVDGTPPSSTNAACGDGRLALRGPADYVRSDDHTTPADCRRSGELSGQHRSQGRAAPRARLSLGKRGGPGPTQVISGRLPPPPPSSVSTELVLAIQSSKLGDPSAPLDLVVGASSGILVDIIDERAGRKGTAISCDPLPCESTGLHVRCCARRLVFSRR